VKVGSETRLYSTAFGSVGPPSAMAHPDRMNNLMVVLLLSSSTLAS